METELHNAKRKKRKTRKCLDELRKRSRKNADKSDLSIPKISKGPLLNNNSSKKPTSNCITSKRLTLTMFAKAVRSETITRPLLCDGKHGNNLVLNARSPVTSPLNIIVESKSSDASARMCNNDTDILIRRSDYGNSFNHDGSSSENIIWFSPKRQTESRKFQDSINEDTLSTATSTSRSNEEPFGYHLYEDLLEDIPLYVKNNLSNLIKSDVIKKAKTCLQSLYMENFRQNHDNIEVDVIRNMPLTSILTSNRSYNTTQETIVQNPIDYIKLGWQQDFHHSEQFTSDGEASPLRSPPLSSPLPQAQIPSIVTYSPDYEFYPHRLNE